MKGSGSPCGACKFLRRKCVRGCVFAPYFSHEQGAAHFAAIHKVFGASNVSKLLAHLPGCKSSSPTSFPQGTSSSIHPTLAPKMVTLMRNSTAEPILFHKMLKVGSSPHKIHGLLPKFDTTNSSSSNNIGEMSYYENCTMNDLNPLGNYENSALLEENTSFGSMDSLEMQSNDREWPFQDDGDDLQSVTFRYIQHS
ncbi:LOB domain-containing protein 29-like [Forsythia ovata]|uniref:LOB domain-containing protein 29-like n=1 Tax=Forsythia ovata TaxID=205694 RepID=A0ABD1VEJ2_9LAMI